MATHRPSLYFGDTWLPPPNEAMGVVLFLGGASGGVVLGAVSDSVYRGQRTPPLLIFTAAQARAYSQLPSSHS
jgi:hypothetical protein